MSETQLKSKNALALHNSTESEVETPHNTSHGLSELTANFAALVVKEVENATANSLKISQSSTQSTRRASSHEYSGVFIDDDKYAQHQAYLIGQSVFSQLIQLLPSLIDERLQEHSSLESPSSTNETITQMRKDIKLIQKQQTHSKNKFEGYTTKTNELVGRIEALENSLKTHFENCKIDANTVNDIGSSQDFVSGQYDAVLKEQMQMRLNFGEMQKKLTKQESKSEQTMNYIKWDHAVFGGIPYHFGPDGIENCKQMIVNICRELHYNIPINEISTAHRLKQHRNKTTPPNIIVRFKDRDIRNDVLKLKPLLRHKTYWRQYGIERLYINEQLTPDKQKLLYQTKVFTREMFRIHGKIFVWSYKGEIYIRKATDYAPKRKINCENDLDNIKRGTLSLDPVTRTRNTPLQNTVVPEMNANDNVSRVPPISPPISSLHVFPALSVTTVS